MHLRTFLLTAALLTAVVPAASAAEPVRLLADADRDGVVSASDLAGRGAATPAAGALVLPNVDDDAGRCRSELQRRLAAPHRLEDLVACHDATDQVVGGPQDALDLAPLRVVAIPDAPDGATASVRVDGPGAGFSRLFRRVGATYGPPTTIDAASLRSGVDLALEATDTVRDPATWDGTIRVVLTVHGLPEGDVSDVAVLRVAPVVLPNALDRIDRTIAAKPLTPAEIRAETRRDRRKQRRSGRRLIADRRAGRPTPKAIPVAALKSFSAWMKHAEKGIERRTYMNEQRRIWQRRMRSVRPPALREIDHPDAWMQDSFEAGTATVPAAHGPQSLRVAYAAGGLLERSPVRASNVRSRDVVSLLGQLRGADSGVLWTVPDPRDLQVWHATGTLEATPPVPGAPNGVALLGLRSKRTSAFATMLGAQGAQPVLRLDTGWLDIGHTDEIVAVVPSGRPRGWSLVVSDPAQALRLLRRLPRSQVLLRGLPQIHEDGIDAGDGTSVARLLSGSVGGATKAAIKPMRSTVEQLRTALSLDEADLIRVPVLFDRPTPAGASAWTGNVVNGITLAERGFVAPDPGVAAFRRAVERAFSRAKAPLRFINTIPYPHGGTGEIHCQLNFLRTPADLRWWQRGAAG